MYSAHNEHDMVFDKWLQRWGLVSHAEIESKANRFRFVAAGDTFTSPKTGKTWKYVKRGNALGVVPA